MQNQLRVLLVEDSRLMRERVIETALEHGCADVIGCADCEDEAFNAIVELQPDAVVLDVQLRQGNGFNLLRRMHELGARERPVVIMFTNYANPEFRKYAADQGATYFLDKASEFAHLEGLLKMLSDESAH